ncbi:hypothetical protein [Limnoglobus roseus]|uniref:Uncharacterized protein n=1 Tax=Limnoglobus roseus TaxID=2598579 RepID=A0A5C1AFI6_9BACT|nr:hypothetical protein [Limnoglobus roseus]QEL16983.1 hypothetical protein PX52LOC_03959 [Limnoglobus roseus]
MIQPPTSPTVPDDLDRTLSDFFKGQLPSTWPACRATAPVEAAANVPAKSAGDVPWTSRTALAASVALVLGLGFFVSSGATNSGRPTGANGSLLSGATANGAGLLKAAGPAEKADDPMKNIPTMPIP